MKRLIILMALLISASGFAEVKTRAATGVAFVNKVTQVDGAIDTRSTNWFIDVQGDYVLDSGLGFGAAFLYVPVKTKILSTFDMNTDIFSMTFGPRYYKDINKWSIYGEAGIGWYKASSSVDTGTPISVNFSKNSLGYNVGAGAEYNVTKKLNVGLATKFHYISDIGGKDDATVFYVGPTLGWSF